MKKIIVLCALVVWGSGGSVAAETDGLPDPPEAASARPSPAPFHDVELPFAQMMVKPGSMQLRGSSPEGQVEFGVRSDEVVSRAVLDLAFTPSSALIPNESQVKVYLNDEMMGMIPLSAEQMGRRSRVQIPLDPRYISDFNRLKLDFVGHYQHICENPASTTLWLDVASDSHLTLRHQKLPVKNELSYFPEPFYDSRDHRPLTLPVVFSGQPGLTQQRAAGMLASWFGTQAQWRGQDFPVLFNRLPERHGIVFATNVSRPDFLRDYPEVEGPTLEMISSPEDPYVKLLLILGRDDEDLVTAVRGLAQGSLLLRGQSVAVGGVTPLEPRQPYDAPNWIRTDRPVSFAELQTYAEQLQSTGLDPLPIALTMNLPPDLFRARERGVKMQLRYRYSAPRTADGSRLTVNLNNQFLRSYQLRPEQQRGEQFLQLLLSQDSGAGARMTIPKLRLGSSNELRFEFDYANPIIGGSPDRCESHRTIPNKVIIDGDSTVDFSGYRHFMAMPDLGAFAQSGFPFSRMADLSQTMVLVERDAGAAALQTLLNVLGRIGAHTGYPGLAVRLSDDWQAVRGQDLDVLVVGRVPDDLAGDRNVHLLLEQAQSRMAMPARQIAQAGLIPAAVDRRPETEVSMASDGVLAAMIGFQSPFHKQRSVVALLADSDRGHQLLNGALLDGGRRDEIGGSVTTVREAGVHHVRVGDIYHVGYLPWWERLWFVLSPHPVVLAVLAALSVLLMGVVLWRGLHALSRRRLSPDNEG
ncbi:cellulose biosynthesis cyclic di-GMP-binding regulatory protein BcsB [Zobellella sp. DQSA1]|uniref:cellulose biosynthesis cyclic di-GMP-binding regulatory protein BcsB n=1 Tax=Zobellella sp. DQSA1 TaxID=3342386 RepID=UPI0035BFB596